MAKLNCYDLRSGSNKIWVDCKVFNTFERRYDCVLHHLSQAGGKQLGSFHLLHLVILCLALVRIVDVRRVAG